MRLLQFLPVIFLLLAAKVLAAPGDILFQEDFNDNADLTADWTITAATMRSNAVTGNPSPALSMEGRTSSQSATSIAGRINAAVPAASLSFWVRRGFDTQGGNCPPSQSCSEYPENGENLAVDYLNSSNNWVRLVTYSGGGTSGEVFNYNQPLPADALHSGLRLRFVHLGGNTNSVGWDFWHVDTVVVTESVDITVTCSSTTTIFSESFNNNGDLNGDWNTNNGVRINSVTSGAASPSVSFDGRSGLHGITSKNNRIDANVAVARLSFWVRRGFDTQGGGCPNNQNCSEYPDNNENLQVEYLNSSGSWVLLQTYTGGGTCGEIFNYSQLLPADALYNNLRLRFRHTGASGSTWDFWHLDDVLVEECSGGSSVDHYSITLPATAVSCESLDITIAAHDGSHNLVDAQGASVTLNTSTGRGTWSGTGVTDSTPNDGTATLAFSSGANAMTVQLSHPDLGGSSLEVLNINVSGGGISETSGSAIGSDDPSVDITDSGFRFVEVNGATVTTVIPNQVAAVQSTENLFIEAVRTDVNTGSCVGVYGAGTTVNLELAAECNNPLNCAGQQVAITNNGNTNNIATNNDNGGVGTSSFTGINLLFASDSRAAFDLDYPDVGAISLHVRDVVSLPGGVTDTLTGSSNSFVVKPYSVELLSAESNDASPVANPGTTNSASGSGFIASGRAFKVEVEVLNADGNVTPNFGNEISPENVAIQFANLVYPTGAGASNGVLTVTNPFVASSSAGVFENDTVRWDEVGTFTVTGKIADDDYLGAGDVSTTPESDNIGRFYPDYFQLDNSSGNNTAGHTCRGYSYLSEPDILLNFTLRAHNASGTVVTNYDDQNLNYANTASPVYHAENSDNGTDLGTQFQSNHNPGWTAGVYDFDNSAEPLQSQLNRVATGPTGPHQNLQLSLSVTEPDSVGVLASQLNQNPTATGDCQSLANCSSAALGFDETSSNYSPIILRYGRAIIESAHGPESAILPAVFGTQFWNGSQFIDATTDSCTDIAFSAISMDGISPITNPQPVSVGSGTSNGLLNVSGLNAITTGGSFNLRFTAPGDTGSFPVIIDLTNYPWLRSDWNQDNDFDSETSLPTATMSFGSYRGHDRVIYWRERFD